MDGQNRGTTFPMNNDDGDAGEIRVLAAAVAAMFGYWIVPDAGNVEMCRPGDALGNVLERTSANPAYPGPPGTGTPKS